jgi:SpoVK/Ycf46/Vps4 family AAA+-type ATPase
VPVRQKQVSDAEGGIHMKNLSLLKPYVHTSFLNNEVTEKVTYLNVPASVDTKTLAADIKKGAQQFQELSGLLEKENEPKYIMISTDNLEQGYMAVSYLAAGFNRKHGMMSEDAWDSVLDSPSDFPDGWEESPRRIPVIMESELKQGMGGGSDPFAMGSMFAQMNQNGINHTPYWMDCVRNSVCIVSGMMGFGMGFGSGNDNDALVNGLSHFKGNDKVYIIIAENRALLWDDEDEDQPVENPLRGKWNYMVLNYAADEASVRLMDEAARKKYYKLLFQGFFAENDVLTEKGFSYEKIVNLMAGMTEESKCQLTEKIVKYAIKDWTGKADRHIKNSDFAFMDRFCRAGGLTLGRKRGTKRAMERLMTELVGMDEVKKQVVNIVNVMKYNQIRSRMNLDGGTYHNVHVMLGAPGTAKTTVAQLMGQIMVEEHLLPDERYTCVNGAELKGMYVGHSAPKTKALFEDNDIIVIDEAYSLVGDNGENDTFSKEALAQLIIELEEHSNDKLVIFAGYGGRKVSEKNNKMKAFLDANPGIKSRITSTIYFDSYSPEEMVEIFMRIARTQNYKVDEAVRPMIAEYFKTRVDDDNFGNGREARSLLETSVVFAASRVLQEGKTKYTKEEMQTITREDVAAAIAQVSQAERVQNAAHGRKIGFN